MTTRKRRSNPHGPELVTRAEVARAAGRDKSWARRAEQREGPLKLKPAMIGKGGTHLFRRDDVERILRAEQSRSGEEKPVKIETISRARAYVPTAENISGEQAGKVFARLQAGESAVQIVAELGIHPYEVESLLECWARLSQRVVLTDAQLVEVCETVRARWKPIDGDGLVLLLKEIAGQSVCTSCGYRTARHCTECRTQYAEYNVAEAVKRQRAAEAERRAAARAPWAGAAEQRDDDGDDAWSGDAGGGYGADPGAVPERARQVRPSGAPTADAATKSVATARSPLTPDEHPPSAGIATPGKAPPPSEKARVTMPQNMDEWQRWLRSGIPLADLVRGVALPPEGAAESSAPNESALLDDVRAQRKRTTDEPVSTFADPLAHRAEDSPACAPTADAPADATDAGDGMIGAASALSPAVGTDKRQRLP
jgi:hypothetical protein